MVRLGLVDVGASNGSVRIATGTVRGYLGGAARSPAVFDRAFASFRFSSCYWMTLTNRYIGSSLGKNRFPLALVIFQSARQ